MAMRRLFALMVAMVVAATVLLASCANEVGNKVNVAKTPIMDREEIVLPNTPIVDVEENINLG